MAGGKITPHEWRWLAVASIVVMALTLVPYVVGLLSATPDMQYGGFLLGLEDMHSYLAKMRYGARDGWIFQLVYTSEPHRGAFVFAFHLALGKLAGALAGHPPPVSVLVIIYHAARVVFGFLMLVVTYRFIAEFLPEVGQRRLAWTLASVGGGLGWLVLVLFGPNWFGILPNEFYIPEGYTFLTLLLLPHLALARALLLLGWLALVAAVERASWRKAILASVYWFGMGVVVPFYAALIGLLVAVWLVTLWIRRRALPRREILLAAVAGLLPALTIAYNFWAFTTDPIFSAWSSQNDLPSPHPLHYVAGYGLLAALAGFGVGPLWRTDKTRGPLLVGWVAVVPALVYLPINVQRRLAEGVIVPLSILATVGIYQLATNMRPPQRRLAISATLAALLPSSLILLVGGAITLSSPHWPLFHPADELTALAWLRDNAPLDAVVLATFQQGNVIPAYADVRVYAGHGPETVDSERKREEVADFFGPTMSDAERQTLLDDGRVDYVFAGPQESAACSDTNCFDPDVLDAHLVFERGDYAIYELTP